LPVVKPLYFVIKIITGHLARLTIVMQTIKG